MSRFPDGLVEEIKDRIDIEAYVSRYVRLRRSGQGSKGLCPFHAEKTPSFHVNREGGFFHCFGCKEGGDVIRFVQLIERLSFPEALERLAEEAGVNLARQRPSPQDETARRKRALLFEANEAAAEFFRRSLAAPAAEEARRYLRERGISAGMQERFRIGYAPAGWTQLKEHLEARGYSEEIGLEAGLLQRTQDGRRVIDVLRERIVFPIRDVRGRVVGFGGRMLPGGREPKYLNTKETPVFRKRQTLYGVYEGRDEARRAGRFVIVEGYTDVIALAQAGLGHAVASLGTAFTAEQGRLLARWAEEVVLAFDADAAGRSATERGLDVLREVGLNVRVALLPEGSDPDTYIQKHGASGFSHLVEQAVSLMEYKLQEALRGIDTERMDGRMAAVRAILPLLAGVSSPVEREGYLHWAAARLRASPVALAAELAAYEARNAAGGAGRHRSSGSRYTRRDYRRGAPVSGSETAAAHHAVAASRAVGVRIGGADGDEAALIAALVHSPEEAEAVSRRLGAEPFSYPPYNRLLAWLSEKGGHGPVNVKEIGDPEAAAAAAEVLAEERRPLSSVEACIERLWLRRMRESLLALEQKLRRVRTGDGPENVEAVGKLLREYRKLRLELAAALAPAE